MEIETSTPDTLDATRTTQEQLMSTQEDDVNSDAFVVLTPHDAHVENDPSTLSAPDPNPMPSSAIDAQQDGSVANSLPSSRAPGSDTTMVPSLAPGHKSSAKPVPGEDSQGIFVDIQSGNLSAVKDRAMEWAVHTQRDTADSVFRALAVCLELAGFAGCLRKADLLSESATFLADLQSRALEMDIDATTYPLSIRDKAGRKAQALFERFWSAALQQLSPVDLLGRQNHLGKDTCLVDMLACWLLPMSGHGFWQLRHVTTVAALSIAEALTTHHKAQERMQATLQKQLEAGEKKGAGNQRQVAQLKKDISLIRHQIEALHQYRTGILDRVVPHRSKDVREVVRLTTVSFVDQLMRSDPDTYITNKYTTRVFFMIHDPYAEVRLRAIHTITQWFSTSSIKKLTTVMEHLDVFCQRSLPRILERMSDEDHRVSAATFKLLRVPAIADRLEGEEFDGVVNQLIGGNHSLAREEAALFVNAHVFQDPGICQTKPDKKKHNIVLPDGEKAEGEKMQDTTVRDLFHSETALSMLVEYLENYVGEHMRLTERVVDAFWGRAPALRQWDTMVNLCLLGEKPERGIEPLNPKQRLGLLFLMEAAVRRAREDAQNETLGSHSAAAIRLRDAFHHIGPELPVLFEVCQAEPMQVLLVSHVCKMLVEYAAASPESRALLNAKVLSNSLRKAFYMHVSMDAMKNCADSLVCLARCAEDAKIVFLDVAKDAQSAASDLLKNLVSKGDDEAAIIMGRFAILANHGITCCSYQMVAEMLDALRARTRFSKEISQSASREAQRPADVVSARVALLLLEAVSIAIMWQVRIAFWVECASGLAKAGGSGAHEAESQVDEMIKHLGHTAQSEMQTIREELPRLVGLHKETCAELITSEQYLYLRFHAFSAYLSMLQVAIGVSEKLSLESADAKPTGFGETFEVIVPDNQMEVLWNFMNGLYSKLSELEGQRPTFNETFLAVQADELLPPPSTGFLTSVRYLTLRQLEHLGQEGNGESVNEEPLEETLLLTVLASRMIQQCDHDDVFAGPLGHLLLSQVERSRPKPLKAVAQKLLQRLRDHARLSDEFGVRYYQMQHEAVVGTFKSIGLAAAQCLNAEFIKMWGIRMLPWHERPFAGCLKEMVLSSIKSKQGHQRLLEVWAAWLKTQEFLSETRRADLSTAIDEECWRNGINPDKDDNILRFTQRLRGLSQLAEDGADRKALQIVAVDGQAGVDSVTEAASKRARSSTTILKGSKRRRLASKTTRREREANADDDEEPVEADELDDDGDVKVQEGSDSEHAGDEDWVANEGLAEYDEDDAIPQEVSPFDDDSEGGEGEEEEDADLEPASTQIVPAKAVEAPKLTKPAIPKPKVEAERKASVPTSKPPLEKVKAKVKHSFRGGF